MAKILVAFFNCMYSENDASAMPLFYEGFVKGLENAGNTVAVVSHPWFGVDFGEIDKELAQTIVDFSPDICFIFNNCFYDLSDVVTCPIVVFEVDSPLYFSNKNVLKSKPDRFFFFLIQSSSKDVLIEQYKVSTAHIFYVPSFSEVYADDNVKPQINISFIGSKFTRTNSNLFSRFLNCNPSEEEMNMWKKCLDEIKNNPQISVTDLVNKYMITSELIVSNLYVPEILQVLSEEKRISVLAAVAELGLDLYGTSNWRNEYFSHTELNCAYKDRKVYSIQHNQEILNVSKVGINVSHLQATSGFPWRIMDIMASNACLVTDYHSDFTHVFPELEKILPVYNNGHEAYWICKDLIEDESRRKDIVYRCNEVINEKYRFVHLLKKMEEYSGVVMHVEK